MFYGRFSGMRERKPGGVLNILSRACRCARVWTVWKKAGKVKIPAGWSEKYLWKDGILYRMTRKKSENTPREKEKMFVRTENSFRKMRIFPLKSPGKSTKMMKTGRKISFPAREKTWKLSRWQGKNVWNWVTESEKSGFFFWKNSGEAQKISKRAEKFLSFAWKKAGKIIPTKRKNLRKRMLRMKKQQIFFADGRKNAEKDARQDRKICRSIRKNMKRSRQKEKRCISGRMVHSEKNGFFIKRIRRKRQTDGKETRES